MDEKTQKIADSIKAHSELSYDEAKAMSKEAGIAEKDFEEAWSKLNSKRYGIVHRAIDMIAKFLLIIMVGIFLFVAFAFFYYLTHTI